MFSPDRVMVLAYNFVTMTRRNSSDRIIDFCRLTKTDYKFEFVKSGTKSISIKLTCLLKLIIILFLVKL